MAIRTEILPSAFPKNNRASVFLFHSLVWMWLSVNSSEGAASDIECLKGVKAQLNDPHGDLSSWDFSNMTEGFICQFNGIECWHPDESKVLNIRLSNMGLRGHFPSALRNCTSMGGLDLSANELSGPLPDDIGRIIAFVTTLDLSSNNFTGEIPASLANCSYLNILRLQHNHFSGQIPWQLGRLNRLSEFSVGDNALSGKIPSFPKPSGSGNNLGPLDFGKPSDPFKAPSKHSHAGIIIGAAVGGTMVGITTMVAILLFSFRKATALEEEEEDPEENKWAKSIKGTKDIKISTFEKSVPKMRLFNLMKATDNFSKKNVIGSGRSGTIYRATFPNGSLLAVRRLEDSHHSDSRFISEMKTLGRIRHSNLVPLLGFCIARKERLLIYKYMAKGSLYQVLHRPEGDPKFIEWPLRLRIAVGTARALAWLHHCCIPCIMLRNISSKRILLDDDYEPRISDFGFAKFMNETKNHASTSTERFCNSGIVAPELITHELVSTPKADVYSFGILMLELITGKEPIQVTDALQNFYGNVAEWIGHLSNYYAIDYESQTGRGWYGEMVKFLTTAFSCIAVVPDERPTMMDVYHLLRAIGTHDGYASEDEVVMSHVYIDLDSPCRPTVIE